MQALRKEAMRFSGSARIERYTKLLEDHCESVGIGG
jgi:hypothetical protein